MRVVEHKPVAEGILRGHPTRQVPAVAPAVPMPEPLLGFALEPSALADVLEEIDNGIVVCSQHGRVAIANDAGRRELRRGVPLAIDAERRLVVCGEGAEGTARCHAALHAAVTSGKRQLLALSDGAERLMVTISPLGQASGTWALVLLGRRQTAPSLVVEMYCKLHELTLSEGSVLAALVAGERAESIAQRRGVTIATVRTQIGALREKLGARRIDDFVRLAAKLPPMAGALRTPGAALC